MLFFQIEMVRFLFSFLYRRLKWMRDLNALSILPTRLVVRNRMPYLKAVILGNFVQQPGSRQPFPVLRRKGDDTYTVVLKSPKEHCCASHQRLIFDPIIGGSVGKGRTHQTL
jgi:hypothetical protein